MIRSRKRKKNDNYMLCGAMLYTFNEFQISFFGLDLKTYNDTHRLEAYVQKVLMAAGGLTNG